MSLSDFVDVQITAGTVQPDRAAFGVPLLLAADAGAVIGVSAVNLGSYAFASSMREVTDLGFATGGSVYSMAEAVFRQSPRPPKVMIGALRTAAITQIMHVAIGNPPPVVGTIYTFEITGPDGTVEAVTYTSIAADTAADVADGLRADAAALTLDVTLSGTTTPLIFTADNADEVFGYEATGGLANGLILTDSTVDASSYTDALTDIHATSGGAFYGVAIDIGAEDALDQAAAWAASNSKLFVGDIVDIGLGAISSDTTAKAASNDRAAFIRRAGFPGESTFDYPGASWMGDMFSRDAGSATWANKTLEGVPAIDISPTLKAGIEAAGANWYASVAGVGVTRPGVAAGGEWLDVTRGLDWLVARMEERLFALQVNNAKIPYTDAGIALVRSEVEGQLKEAETRGLIDTGWVVTVPLAADVSVADRAARELNGVEFQARLTGAIHKTTVRGTVTV